MGRRHGDSGLGVIEPRELMLGGSTEYGETITYRLSKVAALVDIEGTWLDCGCAEGGFSAALLALGARQVVGIDVRAEQIDIARSRWSTVPHLDFMCASAEELPFADCAFDGVLLNEVLEHVGSQERVLMELKRVLKSRARLAVFSPNRWFPFEGHGAVFGRLHARFPFPLLPWLPQRLTWRWTSARNYWPYQLVRVVASAGFTVDHVGFAFPLFAKYRWLPGPLIDAYTAVLPVFERMPVIRRFGVSTLVVAHKA